MKESEIRPKEIFERYIELSSRDGERLDKSKFQRIDCPACNSSNTKLHFNKKNYLYNKCNNCNSLFCSPRPSEAQLDELYFNSESSTYWSNVFFPSVQDARREKMFKPKAQKINALINELNITVKDVCDVGAGHGFLLEELGKISANNVKLHALEPDATSANICRKKGIDVLERTSENSFDWNEKFDLVLSSEVIEHVYSPQRFVKSLFNLVKPNGYVLVTGLGYEGFDILSLQDKSNAVSAPHHLNFLSIDGFNSLFTASGFSNIKIWTPGLLDADIVINSDLGNEFTLALKRRGEDVIKKFQQFLSENKLSSHVWILAQKK